MKINSPVSLGKVVKVIMKKTILTTLSLALVVGAAFATQNFLTKPKLAYAAATPESCFAFSGGNRITNYYDNEGNDSANPVCPRAVDIPATIDGLTVTRIEGGGIY